MIDRVTYMQSYNAERRAFAKAQGICPTCNSEQARPGMVTCRGCGQADRERYMERINAKKNKPRAIAGMVSNA